MANTTSPMRVKLVMYDIVMSAIVMMWCYSQFIINVFTINIAHISFRCFYTSMKRIGVTSVNKRTIRWK